MNRELETRYNQMKQTWKNLVNANVELVDENKYLKEEIERLNNIIKEVREKVNRYPEFNYSNDYMIFRNEIKEILDKEVN